jgi:putative Mg2+ transporter-C (MgtC) family protein
VIWTAAGIGMATGIGYHMLAFCLTIFTLLVLTLFGKVEYLIDLLNHSKTLNLTFSDADIANVYLVEDLLKESGLNSKRMMMNKSGGKLSVILKVTGTHKKFAKLNEDLIRMDKIEDYF